MLFIQILMINVTCQTEKCQGIVAMGQIFVTPCTCTFCSDISIRWDPQILLYGTKYVQVEPEFLPVHMSFSEREVRQQC